MRFDFRGARTGSYWLILEPGAPSVCWDPPGFEVDLLATADRLALHRVWLGHQSLADAMRKGEVALEGPPALRRAFPRWLALSVFATPRSHEPRYDVQASAS